MLISSIKIYALLMKRKLLLAWTITTMGLATLFVTDLALVKSVTVSKTSRQTFQFDCYYRLVLATHCVGMLLSLRNWNLHTNWIHLVPFPVCDIPGLLLDPNFSPRLRNRIWKWPGNEASSNHLALIVSLQDPLPTQPLSGMINKYGAKLRLHFKLELDQLWIGTKGRGLSLY